MHHSQQLAHDPALGGREPRDATSDRRSVLLTTWVRIETRVLEGGDERRLELEAVLGLGDDGLMNERRHEGTKARVRREAAERADLHERGCVEVAPCFPLAERGDGCRFVVSRVDNERPSLW